MVEGLLSTGPTPSSFTKNQIINELVIEVFIEQPLALPGSANENITKSLEKDHNTGLVKYTII